LAVRSIKLLSPEEKLTLVDSCSRMQVFGRLPLVILFIGVGGVDFLPPRFRWPAYFGGWALIGVYFGIVDRFASGRLRKLGINSDYQKAQVNARWLIYLGFLAFFILATSSSFVPK
jgi:hypothetical protein